jgi:hypothetical protein
VHVLGYSDERSSSSVIVVRTGYHNVPGSDYELVGHKLIRRFDPKHEAKRRAARKLREKRLAALRAPAFTNAVKAFAKRIGGKATLVETVGASLPALWEIRLRKRRERAWLDDAKLAGAHMFARELIYDLSSGKLHQFVTLGVVPASMADAVPTLLDYDPEGRAVSPVVAALRRDAGARITICTNDTLELVLDKPCRRIDVHARALAKLDLEETSVADLKKELKAGRVFLWWD